MRAQGLAGVRVFIDDDVSAWNGPPRPAYEADAQALEAGEITAVAVYDLDRLHRQPRDLERFFDVCDRAGVKDLASVAGDCRPRDERRPPHGTDHGGRGRQVVRRHLPAHPAQARRRGRRGAQARRELQVRLQPRRHDHRVEGGQAPSCGRRRRARGGDPQRDRPPLERRRGGHPAETGHQVVGHDGQAGAHRSTPGRAAPPPGRDRGQGHLAGHLHPSRTRAHRGRPRGRACSQPRAVEPADRPGALRPLRREDDAQRDPAQRLTRARRHVAVRQAPRLPQLRADVGDRYAARGPHHRGRPAAPRRAGAGPADLENPRLGNRTPRPPRNWPRPRAASPSWPSSTPTGRSRRWNG